MRREAVAAGAQAAGGCGMVQETGARDGRLQAGKDRRRRHRSVGAPLRIEEALDIVDGWLAQPSVTVIHPTAVVLRELMAPLGTGGNLTGNAHLAALAIEHGAALCSTDADFSRVPGLRWVHRFG